MYSACVWLISRGFFLEQPCYGYGISGHLRDHSPRNAALGPVGRKLDWFHQLNCRSKPKAVTFLGFYRKKTQDQGDIAYRLKSAIRLNRTTWDAKMAAEQTWNFLPRQRQGMKGNRIDPS